MTVDIYFIQFLKDDEVSVGGGGIGTLISYLCPVLENLGHEVTVYQCAGRQFEATRGNTRVVGVPGYPGRGRPNEKVVQSLRELAEQRAHTKERIEIFAGDFFSIKNSNPLAICVQNGLAWDSEISLLTPKRLYHTPLGEKLFRYRCQLRGLRRFETCHNRVAVDLYFLNWYRSFRGPNFQGRLFYNPNPAPISGWDSTRENAHAPSKPIRIIFARRFVPEKGTRMIAEVLKKLLTLRPYLTVTLAGEGPDRDFLIKTFSNDTRVTITTYKTEDTVKIHKAHDIAVIPSLCGEATCLSVLEAMAAGCAVVATNMGGTITEILDGFNGFLCWPTPDSLLDALLKLIDFPEERLSVQKCGWETSQKAFSMKQWESRWRSLIEEVVEGESQARKRIRGL
ncbi:MAG: glycosyltransferase family 4 protein [Thermodesulfovibrionales bacterium]|jgi:glycosyltransferase involved in cell wall biosynthesis